MARASRWLSLILVSLYGLALLSCAVDALPGPRQDVLDELHSKIVGWPWIAFGPKPLTPSWFWMSVAVNFVLVALPFLPPLSLRRNTSTTPTHADGEPNSVTESTRLIARRLAEPFAFLGFVCLVASALLLLRAVVWPVNPGTPWEIRPFATPLPTLGWIASLTAGLLAFGAFGCSRRLASGDANALGSLLGNIGALVRLGALTGMMALVLAAAGEVATRKAASEQSETRAGAGAAPRTETRQPRAPGGGRGKRPARPQAVQ